MLVGPNGDVVAELPRGRTMRQPGHHAQLRPKDADKIATWLLILKLRRDVRWGYKKIANHLNAAGIPSPDAGRTRKYRGVERLVSGQWSPNTVAELCRNSAILGIQTSCRRAEGKLRRMGADGPRHLNESDRLENDKPRVVMNEDSVIIRAPGGYEPLFDPDDWEQLQRDDEARGKCQRGIPRAKDPTKYPLAGTVFDLTDGCGASMHGVTRGKRPLYLCGRYVNHGECKCNSVDADALLKFVLRALVSRINNVGGREKVRTLLAERAEREASATDRDSDSTVRQARRKVSSLERDLATVERRIATIEDDDLVASLVNQRKAIRAEHATAVAQLADHEKRGQQSETTPAESVASAMSVFDQIELVANDPVARSHIAALVERLGVKVGLSFRAAIKGKERNVRRLTGGVLVMGGTPLFVPLHGRDNVDPKGPMQATGPLKAQDPRRIETEKPGKLQADTGDAALQTPTRNDDSTPRGRFVQQGESGRQNTS